MKKILSIAFVSLLFVLPFQSHAQEVTTPATTTMSAHSQYIALLEQLLTLLEQELASIEAQQTATTAPEVTQQASDATSTITTDNVATTTQIQATGSIELPTLTCSIQITKTSPTTIDLTWSFPLGATGTFTDKGGKELEYNSPTGAAQLSSTTENTGTAIDTYSGSGQWLYSIDVSEPGYQDASCSELLQ